MRGITYADTVLMLIYDKLEYFQKSYIFPSQTTFQRWLVTRGGLDISIRTLNRWLHRMENSGLIVRKRRLKHHPRKGLQFNTTLYRLGFLGMLRLRMLGVMSKNAFKFLTGKAKGFLENQPKKEKKGLTPDDKDFHKDFTSLGGVVGALIK